MPDDFVRWGIHIVSQVWPTFKPSRRRPPPPTTTRVCRWLRPPFLPRLPTLGFSTLRRCCFSMLWGWLYVGRGGGDHVAAAAYGGGGLSVSYTHLTLPTICSV